MPFDKPIIVYATTRYEFGRHDTLRWNELNDNIRRLESKDYNVFIANNPYDSEYLKYFTGIDEVRLIPSLCEYAATVEEREEEKDGNTNAVSSSRLRWYPTRRQVLVAPVRGYSNNALLIDELRVKASRMNIEVVTIRMLYPHFEFKDLAQHVAVVLIPIQVSFMLLYELYQLEIPMFAPSPDLLVQWHIAMDIVKERSWFNIIHKSDPAERRSGIPRHENSTSSMKSDPNDDRPNTSSFPEWVHLSDFYRLPYITLFNSWEDLLHKLVTVDVMNITASMSEFNKAEAVRVRRLWKQVLQQIELHPSLQKKRSIFDLNHNNDTVIRRLGDSCEGDDTSNNRELQGKNDPHLVGCNENDTSSDVIVPISLSVGGETLPLTDESLSSPPSSDSDCDERLLCGCSNSDRCCSATPSETMADLSLADKSSSSGSADSKSTATTSTSVIRDEIFCPDSISPATTTIEEGELSFVSFRESLLLLYDYDIDKSYYC
jgi:hypothetical protein